MGIKIVADLGGSLPLTETGKKRLRKIVRESMDKSGNFGISISGQSLSFAVEWCEEKRVPYTIKAMPGIGYALDLGEKDMM